MGNNVIAIKHGSLTENIEAYADIENGKVEDVDWDDGPSNEFYAAAGNIRSMPNNENYEKGYDEINWHHEEEDEHGEEEEE